VPEAALSREGGLDFVAIEGAEGEELLRAVVPGGTVMRDGETWREILTGLNAGDRVVIDHE
jgi:multidrug efflux system membrane fusion protein